MKTIIIAEAGINHNGQLRKALRMVDVAKNSGADYVKFQIWNPKNLKPGPWDKDGRKEIYFKAFLNKNKFKILYNYSKKIGVDCFASIFSDLLIRISIS